VNDLLKRPGYRLYPPDSSEAEALLIEQGLSPAGLDHALSRYQTTTGTCIDTILGLNEDGIFGTTGEPAAGHETLVPLLWLQVLELLGRVPEGSTPRFLQHGALPA
jgi:hypothetical protein